VTAARWSIYLVAVLGTATPECELAAKVVTERGVDPFEEESGTTKEDLGLHHRNPLRRREHDRAPTASRFTASSALAGDESSRLVSTFDRSNRHHFPVRGGVGVVLRC